MGADMEADTVEKVPGEADQGAKGMVVRVPAEITKEKILKVKLSHKSGNFYVSPGSVSGPFASFA